MVYWNAKYYWEYIFMVNCEMFLSHIRAFNFASKQTLYKKGRITGNIKNSNIFLNGNIFDIKLQCLLRLL